jgi:integrase
VRWREARREGGVGASQQRERVVVGEAAAWELAARVERDLGAHGAFLDAAPTDEARETVAAFDQAGVAFLTHKAARGAARGTLQKYGTALQEFCREVRRLTRLPEAAPIPISSLSRGLFADVQLRWRARGLSDSSVYTYTRVALAVWLWASDDPARWVGTPRPPRDTQSLLPNAPIYMAPPAPRLAEADACIRRIPTAAYVARGAAILMRYTGLRVSQVLALEPRHLDEEALTLEVPGGRSRREKEARRRIPISADLLRDLEPYRQRDGISLIRRRRDARVAVTESHRPANRIKAAWRAATEAGEAREEVWRPSNRKIARPDHAFRAALQAALVKADVRDEVINALVGHSDGTTRGRHYAGWDERFDAMRRAVALIPPIDWGTDGRGEGSDARV